MFALTLRSGLLACGLAAVIAAATADARPARPRVDLANVAAGVYQGDVISDARGSSRENVTVTVTRTGPNQVSVTSNYSRIPARTFRLVGVMNTIQNSGGTEVFLADRSKSPLRLDLTIDDASWSGERSAGGR